MRNNKSSGRIVSIPKTLMRQAGIHDWQEVEGRWSVWSKGERFLVLELRSAEEKRGED